jgi:hypothetical protein
LVTDSRADGKRKNPTSAVSKRIKEYSSTSSRIKYSEEFIQNLIKEYNRPKVQRTIDAENIAQSDIIKQFDDDFEYSEVVSEYSLNF